MTFPSPNPRSLSVWRRSGRGYGQPGGLWGTRGLQSAQQRNLFYKEFVTKSLGSLKGDKAAAL